ncbi:tRNA dihydrouridine synthase [Candidatus Nitrospira bockiana]
MNWWRRLPQPVIGLSPMDGVTDAAFRRVVARQGPPDVVFTEFTNVCDLCRGPEACLSTFLYSEVERPIVAQLYGKHPDLFYQAAHIVCELGFDGLDLNMGCPSKNVASSGSGAGLIRTPDLAHEIIRAARQGVLDWAGGQSLASAGIKTSRVDAIRAMNLARCGRPDALRRPIPVSVKTRIGYDDAIVEQWIPHLLKEQPAVISVHGRTLTQMYRGEADWDAIARAADLVRGTDTLVLGNGDLESMEHVVRRVRASGVHGVLVGRGSLGAPWFFRTKEAARRAVCEPGQELTGLVPDVPRQERFRVMLDHARRFEELFGVRRFPRMRKHLGWYCTAFPHAAAMRASMVRASSSADVEAIVAAYDSRSSPAAPDKSDSPAPFSVPLSCG